ncbi:hypothetical protein Ancab_013055 [Ancistrocladus abbreviatus]
MTRFHQAHSKSKDDVLSYTVAPLMALFRTISWQPRTFHHRKQIPSNNKEDTCFQSKIHRIHRPTAVSKAQDFSDSLSAYIRRLVLLSLGVYRYMTYVISSLSK